jgi:hypothetical protein
MKLATHLVIFVVSWLCLALPAVAQSRTCPVEVIRKDQIESVVERRQTTFKHCLACEGDVCQFRQWPEEGKDFANACRVLFCTPTEMPGKMFLPDNVTKEAGIFFTYGINKQGRIDNVEITELLGGITETEARKMIRNYFERRRYEPITIDGQTYELQGLKDGTNYEVVMRNR